MSKSTNSPKKKASPFVVIDNGLRLLLTPDSGWYAVQGLDIRGLNTQGRTIEEAIYMAHDAAKALEEARAIMAKELAKRTREAEKAAGVTPQKKKAVMPTLPTK